MYQLTAGQVTERSLRDQLRRMKRSCVSFRSCRPRIAKLGRTYSQDSPDWRSDWARGRMDWDDCGERRVYRRKLTRGLLVLRRGWDLFRIFRYFADPLSLCRSEPLVVIVELAKRRGRICYSIHGSRRNPPLRICEKKRNKSLTSIPHRTSN